MSHSPPPLRSWLPLFYPELDLSCLLRGFPDGWECVNQSRSVSSSDGLVPWTSLPLLREEEVDPLGYGLASLGREQSFFFGDVQHRFGHLVQRRFIRVQPPRYVGVPCTKLDVAVLQREKRHKEIDQVS